MTKLIKKTTFRILLSGYRDYCMKKRNKLYRRNKVLCPICNLKFNEFEPFGIVPRKNARCPNCGALERHRLLWKYLYEKTDLFYTEKKIRLLHFAPEKAFYDIFSVNQNIEYNPCDLFPESYNKYYGKIKVKKVDIIDIPFEENYFDIILCNHVLEHIPNDLLAMSELYRVMKKGAWAILQVPIDYNREITYEDFSITTPEGKEKAFGQNDHVRCYGRDYKDRLGRVGFRVNEDNFIKSFTPENLFRYGLMGSELIYCCKK
jgi:SAM-dependent methyltransferase